MKKHILKDDVSEFHISKEQEKIYPFCISLVTAQLNEIENDWLKRIKNNIAKKNLIQLLFSLLNYEIILIQQISKYYNLYIYNLEEDNIKLMNQIISINKELMNKKIKAIIATCLNSNENNNNDNDQNIFNYKILKFNEKNKKVTENKLLQLIENDTDSIKEFCFSDTKKSSSRNKNNNDLNRNFSYEERDKMLKQNKREEKKNNSILSNKNTNMESNNNINNNNSTNQSMKSHLKRKNNKISIICCSPYVKKKIIETPKDNKIKINLANKFMRNNLETNDQTTISNLSRQSKKSFHNNLCLTQTTFNAKKKENIYTIPNEENPVRKVKNIILNAKNSNLLVIRTNTPTNIRLLHKHQHLTMNENQGEYFLSEGNKDIITKIKKNYSRNILLTNSYKNLYCSTNNEERKIKKSMSNKNFLNVKNMKKQINNKTKRPSKIQNNKERKCNQILKDGMKKMEKRLSKDAKKELFKTKSNESISIIKKISTKSNGINNKKVSKILLKNFN